MINRQSIYIRKTFPKILKQLTILYKKIIYNSSYYKLLMILNSYYYKQL